jgi:hypothetical protein
MKNVLSTKWLLALPLLSAFSGCKDDLDATAPYKEITVAYCLLNKTDSIHWVRIKKAFLGQGNAYEYAQIADSTTYTEAQLPEEQRFIEKVNEDGNVVHTFYLHDTLVSHDPGIFAGPDHKLYYFRGDANNGGLQAEQDPVNHTGTFTYRLKATPKGNAISATTSLVNDFVIYSQTANISNPNSYIEFKNSGGYLDYVVRWFPASGGKRYDVYYRFQYDEVYADGTRQRKNFLSQFGTLITDFSFADVSVPLSGELFYQEVANRIPSIAQSPNVVRRIFRGLDLIWAVGGPELHTYLQLANPISGIVEERPDYSNIANGYGLMSSRIFQLVGSDTGDHTTRKWLKSSSMDELLNGSYTGDRGFCSPLNPGCE